MKQLADKEDLAKKKTNIPLLTSAINAKDAQNNWLLVIILADTKIFLFILK
jgi:hypothetical protein